MGMKIFLIGFMGVGKTTIGKRLAAKLNFNFVDSDAAIEKNEGQTITEIFSDKGENYFRTLERSFLETELENNSVVALGGGTPCFQDNMELINKMGITVYLQMPTGLIVNRLKNAKGKRPLIEAVKEDEEQLRKVVEAMLNERFPFYEKASITADASNFNASKMDSLIQLIQLSQQSHS